MLKNPILVELQIVRPIVEPGTVGRKPGAKRRRRATLRPPDLVKLEHPAFWRPSVGRAGVKRAEIVEVGGIEKERRLFGIGLIGDGGQY